MFIVSSQKKLSCNNGCNVTDSYINCIKAATKKYQKKVTTKTIIKDNLGHRETTPENIVSSKNCGNIIKKSNINDIRKNSNSSTISENRIIKSNRESRNKNYRIVVISSILISNNRSRINNSSSKINIRKERNRSDSRGSTKIRNNSKSSNINNRSEIIISR